jgi:hypothetical protein
MTARCHVEGGVGHVAIVPHGDDTYVAIIVIVPSCSLNEPLAQRDQAAV